MILKKADLEGSLAVLHSEQAASLTPSRYILLVESGPIDTTESVLWPNRERRTCARTIVETSRYCIGLQLFVQLAPNTKVTLLSGLVWLRGTPLVTGTNTSRT